MKYILMIIGILPSIYCLNFARYCHSKKDNRAAAGAAVIALVSGVLSIVTAFIRW